MRRLPLYLLERLEMLEVLEFICRVLRCMREAVEGELCVPQVLQVLGGAGDTGSSVPCATLHSGGYGR